MAHGLNTMKNAGQNLYEDNGKLNAEGKNGTGNNKSSKNERHRDGGRAKTKAEGQIEKLKEQASNASNKVERKKIEQKIRNIEQDAARKAKGEEHSKANKR